MASPSFRADCLILKNVKLKETDLILSMLSSEGELVQALAHGARKPGSKFGGRLMCFNQISLLMRGTKSLKTISEASLIHAPQALYADLQSTAAAATICACLEKFCFEGLKEPRLYLMSTEALRQMNIQANQGCYELVHYLALACLLKIVAQLGFLPNLSRPKDADNPLYRDYDYVFDFEAGGFELLEPYSYEETMAYPASFELLGWMEYLLYSSYADISKDLKESPPQEELFNLILAWVQYCCSARIKSVDLWRELSFSLRYKL